MIQHAVNGLRPTLGGQGQAEDGGATIKGHILPRRKHFLLNMWMLNYE
jgi:hypothetical protein